MASSGIVQLMRAALLALLLSTALPTVAFAQTQGQPAAPRYDAPAAAALPRGAAPHYDDTPAPPVVFVRAPRYSLWAGARLSFVGFGFDLYRSPTGADETTGNLIGNGIAPEFDLGIRIEHRFVPYVFFEHGFLQAGHRFDGDGDASASTDYYGVGLRFLSGNVDFVSFASDISVGRREISVRNGTGTYTMTGLEFLRLGLGADIRLSSSFTLSPLLSVSGGALKDTSGSITWATGGDGVSHPPYENGTRIDESRPYVMLSAGIGAHFDLVGAGER